MGDEGQPVGVVNIVCLFGIVSPPGNSLVSNSNWTKTRPPRPWFAMVSRGSLVATEIIVIEELFLEMSLPFGLSVTCLSLKGPTMFNAILGCCLTRTR